MCDITPQKPVKNKYKRIHDDIYSSDEEFITGKKPKIVESETEYRQKIINAEWAEIFTLTDQIKKLVRSRPENFNLMIRPLQQQRRIHINKLYRIDHWEGYDASMFVFQKNNTV